MSLKTEKVNEESFYKIDELTNEITWLKNREYEKGILALWNFCELEFEKKLIIELLKRLHHLDSYSMNDLAYNIIDKIEEWELDADNSIIVATSDGKEIDGSVSGLQFLKNKLNEERGWSERNLFATFEAATPYLERKPKTNVMIFDDFIGTGKTIVNKVNSFQEKLKEGNLIINKIYILSYISMNFGLQHIKEQLKLELYSPLILKKGITGYESTEKTTKIEVMKSLESKLQKKYNNLKLKDFTLGYGQSETLYQIYGFNCSNNVFPIFWWPKECGGKKRDTLFKRLR